MSSTGPLNENQQPRSLAGQIATIVYEDGTKQAVTFGPDVCSSG
jgi:hypothetical protein